MLVVGVSQLWEGARTVWLSRTISLARLSLFSGGNIRVALLEESRA